MNGHKIRTSEVRGTGEAAFIMWTQTRLSPAQAWARAFVLATFRSYIRCRPSQDLTSILICWPVESGVCDFTIEIYHDAMRFTSCEFVLSYRKTDAVRTTVNTIFTYMYEYIIYSKSSNLIYTNANSIVRRACSLLYDLTYRTQICLVRTKIHILITRLK